MIVLVSASRGGKLAIQFQTRMLPSDEPDTILVPSGEKPTEYTRPLWALGCSSTSAILDASAHHITPTHTASAAAHCTSASTTSTR